MNQNYSYRTLRKAIGILGIFLPIFLLMGETGVGSISYYYYTKMSVVFTGILFAFGLILITYRGSEASNKEYILTNIGGFFALMVAIVPTKFQGTHEEFQGLLYYAHIDEVRKWIHNISAVLFIFIMGLIVLKHFTKPGHYTSLYKFLSVLVFIGLGFAILAVAFEQYFFKTAVFWGETLALWAFGLAWLRRGTHYKKKILKLL